jgi:hypothetical protein
MESPSVDSILAGVPDRMDPILFAGVDATLQLAFAGAAPPRHLRFRDGKVEVHPGEAAEPTASVSMSAEDFVKLCQGQLSQFQLFASGRATFSGDLMLIDKARWVLFPMRPQLVQMLDEMEARFRRTPVHEIPTVDALDRAALLAHGREQRPLLLRGVLAETPAARWTLDSVDRDFGHLPFSAGLFMGTLGDFIKIVRAGGFVNSNATQLPPEMEAGIGGIPGVPEPAIRRPLEIFFTSRDSSSSLHRDMLDGLLTCLLGPRELQLFGPEQRELVYCYRNAANGYQGCHVDGFKPDLARFPRFADAQPIAVTISPGDLLFLPMGWFHQVRSVDDSIAVKFNLRRDWLEKLTAA